MRYLVLTDLHANWEALEAVLAAADGKYDRILCCGDVVGYGADPNRVTLWVRENVAAIVRGNHDRACAGLEDLQWFNPVAREAAEWTQAQLTSDNLRFLRDLEPGPRDEDGIALVHGSPADEDEYVATVHEVAQQWPYLQANLTFFGHTHLQCGFQFVQRSVRKILRAPAEDETIELDPGGVYLINPGSVGQPRDRDARAAWVVYDSAARLLTFRRVKYDVPAAQEKILAAGLPPVLAARLLRGE